MTRVQIPAYLDPDEHAALTKYGRHLDRPLSAIGRLLIYAELRDQRLSALAENYAGVAPSQTRQKVTIHVRQLMKDKFQAHSNAINIQLSRATTILLRAELHERTLTS